METFKALLWKGGEKNRMLGEQEKIVEVLINLIEAYYV